MAIDLPAARRFIATHARMLDRRRFAVLFDDGDPGAVLGAVEAYRNADGGYGWGLEPDLRCATSQPGGALHALEAFADAAPATTPRAVELCDWLDTVSLPDGGLPFALPVVDDAGVAPFWANADPAVSSLQITSFVATQALRAAAHDAAVAAHPWPRRATRFCLAAIDALGREPHALVLTAAVGLLDAIHDGDAAAPALLARLGALIPADGRLHVAGGREDEATRPLDLAPAPSSAARKLFADDVVADDLRRLADEQQEDGGWHAGFDAYSPAAALEWRGYTTVRAVGILRANGLA